MNPTGKKINKKALILDEEERVERMIKEFNSSDRWEKFLDKETDNYKQERGVDFDSPIQTEAEMTESSEIIRL